MKEAKKTSKRITIDDLAAMIADGFAHTASKAEFTQLSAGQNSLKADIARLEQGQEEIKLRLDHAVYRFEHIELEKRVSRLETRVGIRNK